MAKPSGKKYNVIDVYNMTLKDFENMCRAYGSSTTLRELAESAKRNVLMFARNATEKVMKPFVITHIRLGCQILDGSKI